MLNSGFSRRRVSVALGFVLASIATVKSAPALADVGIAWEVALVPDEGPPDQHTRVMLVLQGDIALRIDLGTLDGDCTNGRNETINSPSIQCQFGGGESSLSVTRRGRNLVLTEQSEGSPSLPTVVRTIAIFPLPRGSGQRH
jgi:hypothetical protein